MVWDEGMGSCMIPVGENGYPCGRQIEQGEPIGSVLVGMSSRIGHKRCKDEFYERKQKEAREQMAKRLTQQGAGGPVDLNSGVDAILGSIPLIPKKQEPEEEPTVDPSALAAVVPDEKPPPSSGEDWADHVPFVGVRNGQVVISDLHITRDGNVHLTPEHAEDLAEDLQQKAARAKRTS